MYPLKTREDLEELIQSKIPESLHLEYKSSDVLSFSEYQEIAQDVSAFANSDGGQIVYGIEDDPKRRTPRSLDNGVNWEDLGPEKLATILEDRIQPPIQGLIIVPISLEDERIAYSIEIPKSFSGPHKVGNTHYKRFNSLSIPMEGYEVEDVRNRVRLNGPLITISIVLKGTLFHVQVANESAFMVRDVKIALPADLPWMNPGHGFSEKVFSAIPPKTALSFLLNTASKVFSHSFSKKFSACLEYVHPMKEQIVNERSEIDLEIYRGTIMEKSELEELKDELKKAAERVANKLDEINTGVKKIGSIANPTGLRISYSSLDNLHSLASGKKVTPDEFFFFPKDDFLALMEIFSVDQGTSMKLKQAIQSPGKWDECMQGVPPELEKKFSILFGPASISTGYSGDLFAKATMGQGK